MLISKIMGLINGYKGIQQFKILMLIVSNSILLYLLYMGYKDISRKQEIINIQKPIKVKILDVYGGRGRSSCKVEFNNHIYNNISLPINDLKIGSSNDKYFYYDREKNTVFSDNLQKRAVVVIGILFIFSLLLWFVPVRFL